MNDTAPSPAPASFLASLRYYAQISSFPMIGLTVLLLLRWYLRGYIVPFDDRPWDGYAFILPPALYFLSLPFAFAMWVYAVRDAGHLPLSFSGPTALLSIAGFAASATFDLKTQHHDVIASCLVGCVAGCFVFIRFRDFCRIAFLNERKTCVAMMGIVSSAGYSLMDNYLWERMAYSSARTSQWLLELFQFPAKAGVVKDKHDALSTILTSEYFTILVYQACSGLEGIFLFTFLLSALVLCDWKLLQRIYLIETYLMGFIFMYLANVIRISSLFLLGHFANAPNASPLMASMRGLPLHLFHSFIGQFYYIIVFMIFGQFLYRYALKREAQENMK